MLIDRRHATPQIWTAAQPPLANTRFGLVVAVAGDDFVRRGLPMLAAV